MPLYAAMALSLLSGLAKLLGGVLGALCLPLPSHREAASAPESRALRYTGSRNSLRLALGPSVAAVRPLFDLCLSAAHRTDPAHRLGLEAPGRVGAAGALPVSARVRPLPRRWKRRGLKPFPALKGRRGAFCPSQVSPRPRKSHFFRQQELQNRRHAFAYAPVLQLFFACIVFQSRFFSARPYSATITAARSPICSPVCAGST